MKLYKCLTDEGNGPFSNVPWHLPKGKRPGKWMPPIDGAPQCGSSGYWLCRTRDIIEWVNARIFEVEVKMGGNLIENGNKIGTSAPVRLICETAWNAHAARLFACDCASHVISNFEDKYPNDSRPRDCIITTRRFARGNATWDEVSAAYSAADCAAGSAAYCAAGSAAYCAAYSATGSAADCAAYSAAGCAAYSAADCAAYSATDSAAGCAAYSAAYSAERLWQTRRIMQYIRGSVKHDTPLPKRP